MRGARDPRRKPAAPAAASAAPVSTQ
jgi:hypothetical protein